MPRQFHSSRSYQVGPDANQEPAPPARKFPVIYLYLIGGGLVAASICITGLFLMSPPAKVATKKGGNTLRAVAPSQEATPEAAAATSANTSLASPDDAPATTSANQPFSLRTANSDPLDAISSDASPQMPGLSADDVQRKDSLALLEFRSKNYSEAERIYREILPVSTDQPLAFYRIFTCVLLQNRRDDAAKLLNDTPSLDQSPALAYCQATQAFVDGNAAAAKDGLAQARQKFAAQCDAYDPTLKDLGFLP